MKYIFLLLIMLVPSASALGMASSYLPNKTMYLNPGMEREYKIELQNNDDSIVRFSLEVEGPFVSVIDQKEEYVVGRDKPVQEVVFLIDVPKDAQTGEYEIRYWAVPQVDSENPIGLNLKFNDRFSVVVEGEYEGEEIAEEKKSGMQLLILIIMGLALAGVIFKRSRKLTEKVFGK
jgi:hypothetical protein